MRVRRRGDDPLAKLGGRTLEGWVGDMCADPVPSTTSAGGGGVDDLGGMVSQGRYDNDQLEGRRDDEWVSRGG